MDLVEKLRHYYKKLFPFHELSNLIPISEYREISLTKNNNYIRNVVFNDVNDLKQKLIQIAPEKFDIGAIFREKLVMGAENVPKLKELVFDVDLTDYPRKCCTGKNICNNCFIIIKIAIKILDFALKNELGYKNYRFFFSGGRGVHCWVFDELALKLNNIERKGIVDYFNSVLSLRKYKNEYTEILRGFSNISEKDLYETLFLRLDANVTCDIKHLLKSPFCVHPLTGKICVNLSVENIDNINLENIPSLDDVISDESKLLSFLKYL